MIVERDKNQSTVPEDPPSTARDQLRELPHIELHTPGLVSVVGGTIKFIQAILLYSIVLEILWKRRLLETQQQVDQD